LIAALRDRERARARDAGEGDRDPDWAHDARGEEWRRYRGGG